MSAESHVYDKRTTAEQVTEGLNLEGRVIIVTGGNSGLGEETARVLALRGADVIITARKESAGEKTKAMIEAKHPGTKIRVMVLDLASKASVHTFVDKFLALESPLHVLINNAGCMAIEKFTKTEDGREMQFGTNHIGHFLLVQLLLPKLKASAVQSGSVSRIVILSSLLHAQPYPEGIRFDALDSGEDYEKWKAYGQSKLANMLHAKELAKRLKGEGVESVVVNSVHPGVILTNLLRHSLKGFKAAVFGLVYKVALQWYWKTIPEGAATTCYVATHPLLATVSGKYFSDCAEKAPSEMGQNDDMAAKLWAISEGLVAS